MTFKIAPDFNGKSAQSPIARPALKNAFAQLEQRFVFDAALMAQIDQAQESTKSYGFERAARHGCMDFGAAAIQHAAEPAQLALNKAFAPSNAATYFNTAEASSPVSTGRYASQEAYQAALANGTAVDAPAANTDLTTGTSPQVPVVFWSDKADATAPVEVYVIDANLEDKAVLLASLPVNAKIIEITAGSDGVNQLASAMGLLNNVSGLHILSHGNAGEFKLGTSLVNAESMNGQYADALRTIGNAMSASGDILIYGCDFAQGEIGSEATRILATLTDADVAASIDTTGAASLNGNWLLEKDFGAIESKTLRADAWSHELASLEIAITAAPETSGGTNVGAVGIYRNAGTVGGVAVDLKGTVIAADAGAEVHFEWGPSHPYYPGDYNTNDPLFSIRTGAGGPANATVKWEVFKAGTNEEIRAKGDIKIFVGDLDGEGGAASTVETIKVGLANLNQYTVNADTNVKISNDGTYMIASGTNGSNGNSPQTSVQFDLTNVDTWTIEYQSHRANDYRTFILDGNGDLKFDNPVVTVVNNVPVAVDDAFSTKNNTPVSGSAAPNDSDPDKDPLTFSKLTDPANGAVVFNADGTFTYTPNASFSGVDSFTYKITDGKNGFATATVSITVAAPDNKVPDARDDVFSTAEDTTLNGTVATNDSDPDGNPLIFTQLTQPTHGTITFNNDGSFTYVPAANFNGVDQFTYEISDGKGGKDTAIAVINIAPVNDPPIVIDPVTGKPPVDPNAIIPAQKGMDGSPITPIDVSKFFTDIDDATLSYAATGLPKGLSLDPVTGKITGTPANDASAGGPNKNGVYSVVVTAKDAAGASVSTTFTYTIGNPPPAAVADSASTLENTPVSGSVGLNDSDPDGDSLTFAAASQPSKGSVSMNADGTYVYTPAAGAFGTDTFTYTVTDAQGAQATATVTITIAKHVVQALPPCAPKSAYSYWL